MYEEYNIRKKLRDDFLEKAREKYKGVYSYPHIFTEFQNSNSYITVICNKHHTTYKTRPANHLKYSGCKWCMKEIMRIPLEEVLRRFKKVHGDTYDYSEMEYVDGRTKVKIICPKHGPFYQTPSHHMLGQRCIKCIIEARTKNLTKSNFDKSNIKKYEDMLKERYPNLTIDFSQVKSMDIPVEIVCKIHGPFQKAIHNLFRPGDNGCKFCNRNSPAKREEFMRKAILLHGDWFDYSKMDMNELKPIFICKKHNLEFRQEKRNHLVYNGCPECFKEMRAMTPEKFIKRAKELHDNFYMYDKCEYKGYYNKVTVICPIHGEFQVIAGEHIREPSGDRKPTGCQRCSIQSKSEKVVMDYFDEIGITYIHQFKLNEYLFRWDFVIEDIKLNIEIDDDSHITSPSTIEYDPVKEDIMRKLGYNILRIKDVNSFSTLCELKSKLKDYIKYIRDKRCFKDFLSFKEHYNLPDDANPDDYKQYEYKP